MSATRQGGQIMYYHNGKGYDVGVVITTIDGVFGRVEVAYKTPAPVFTVFDLQPDMTPQVEAYTFGRDGKPLFVGRGETVQAAVKSLYAELARVEAEQSVRPDRNTVNGIYEDMVIRNRPFVMFATREDSRLMARKIDGKMLNTEIAPEEILTLERCRELAQRAGELLGETVTRMRITHNVDAAEGKVFEEYDRYWGEGGEWPITHLVNREYRYHAERNALLVMQDDEYLMTNDDGEVCDDPDAIADTLS